MTHLSNVSEVEDQEDDAQALARGHIGCPDEAVHGSMPEPLQVVCHLCILHRLMLLSLLA